MTAATPRAWSLADIGYCTNVHPGETLPDIHANLQRYVARVRAHRGLPREATALWLSAACARQLAADHGALEQLIAELDRNGIDLTSINGFPYGGFHTKVVKERVYLPDWSSRDRLAYTLDLAEILAHALPSETPSGWISTLPLGTRAGWTTDKERSACGLLTELVQGLIGIERRTGKTIGVCLEMEPGCALENSAEAIRFLTHTLPSSVGQNDIGAALLQRHLGVCLDICHLAVIFEDPAQAIRRCLDSGVTIGKIQVSSALHVADPADPGARAGLKAFCEPRYCHQTHTISDEGERRAVMDLHLALDDPSFPTDAPWRTHFHVPIGLRQTTLTGIETTQAAIGAVLDLLRRRPDIRPHIEVETYTWQVLPESLRPQTDEALVTALARELEWLVRQMDQRGLLSEDK